jgi:hypothetical protein
VESLAQARYHTPLQLYTELRQLLSRRNHAAVSDDDRYLAFTSLTMKFQGPWICAGSTPLQC